MCFLPGFLKSLGLLQKQLAALAGQRKLVQCAWEENALSFHTISVPLNGMDEAPVAPHGDLWKKKNGWVCIVMCTPGKVTSFLERKSAAKKGLGDKKDT